MARWKEIVVEAPCKVNLFLEILGVDQNRYHRLTTLLQSTSLADLVTLQRREDRQVFAVCSDPILPTGEENLAVKAALTFQKLVGTDQGITIGIDKMIPARAGLGGGSGNAAAVLVGLNQLYEAGLSTQELCQLGSQLGVDVPFCIMGGAAWGENYGEILTPTAPLSEGWLVIAKPEEGTSTPEAFRLYDDSPREEAGNRAIFEQAWNSRDLAQIGRQLYNSFQQLLPDSEPKSIHQWMAEAGSVGSVLSGSGSAVVGIFLKEAQANRCKNLLENHYPFVAVAQPVDYGARVLESR